MVMQLYSIRDVAAQQFTEPRLFQTEQAAVRDFQMLVNDNGPVVIKFRPADFDLFHLGQIDLSSGSIQPLAVPAMIVNGASLFGGISDG